MPENRSGKVGESVSFPHTKGLQNQNYEIKAYSDNPVSLFIPV